MGETNLLISQISTETRNWKARVTLTEKIPSLPDNAKSKRYIIVDEEGNEILAVVFKEDIPYVDPAMHLFQVYDIINADVKILDPRFRILDNPYQWVLQRSTMIEPVTGAMPNLRYFLNNLVPFGILARTANFNHNNVDIMGVVIAAEEQTTIKTVNGYKNVQRFTFVDTEKIPIIVTLWDEMIDMQGSTLMEAANTMSVVVAKRLSFSTYRGAALSAKKSSTFALNPPVEAAMKLREWIRSKNIDEIEELLVDKSIVISKELVNEGTIKTYTVSELANVDKGGLYWVKGVLQISDEDHRLFYIGCPYCNSRSSAQEAGRQYRCYNCRREVQTAPRAMVLMIISDKYTSMKVIAIADVAERILQATAERIFNLSKLGQQYDLEYLKSGFEGKVYLMQLRRSSGQQSEGQKKMVLSAFYEENDPTIYDQFVKDDTPGDSSGKGKSIEATSSPLSPLKRQIMQISLAPDTPINKKLFIRERSPDQHGN